MGPQSGQRVKLRLPYSIYAGEIAVFSTIKTKRLFIGGALAATCLASPASAAQFLFNFDGATVDVAGTLTTNDTPDLTGGLLITDISGTLTSPAGTDAITALLAPGAFAANDNLLFPDRNPLLSTGGFSFSVSGISANIFFSSLSSNITFLTTGFAEPGSFTVSRVTTTPPPVGAIPEPGTWALMLMGFGFVGAAMRRRGVVRTTVAYT